MSFHFSTWLSNYHNTGSWKNHQVTMDFWIIESLSELLFVLGVCVELYITWRLEKNVKHLYALGSSSCFQSSLRTAASWIHAREGAVGIAVFFLMWCLVRKSSNTTMYEGLFLLPKLLDLFFLSVGGPESRCCCCCVLCNSVFVEF